MIHLSFVAAVLLASAMASGKPRSQPPLAIAVLDFQAEGDLAPLGAQLASLTMAELSNDARFITVERASLEQVLSELELGLSGTVRPESAAAVGSLTGAKVLVTGRAFPQGDDIVIVAKVIGTETSRVYGETAEYNQRSSPVEACKVLSSRIADTIVKNAGELLSKPQPRDVRIHDLRAILQGEPLPLVTVQIEERHNGRRLIDPAAQTEVAVILDAAGFELADAEESTKSPDLRIVGEALSEFGTRRGGLTSCRGRVELKVLDGNGKILAVDRQTEVAVDLSEELAGKAALQKAAVELAFRIAPKLISR